MVDAGAQPDYAAAGDRWEHAHLPAHGTVDRRRGRLAVRAGAGGGCRAFLAGTSRNCIECDLSARDLKARDFKRAKLDRANLGNADLSGASLFRALLVRADLSGAKLKAPTSTSSTPSGPIFPAPT